MAQSQMTIKYLNVNLELDVLLIGAPTSIQYFTLYKAPRMSMDIQSSSFQYFSFIPQSHLKVFL